MSISTIVTNGSVQLKKVKLAGLDIDTIPSEFDFSQITNLDNAFKNTYLKSINITAPLCTSAIRMLYNTRITNATLNMNSLINNYHIIYSCDYLTDLEINMNSLVNYNTMTRYMPSLVNATINAPNIDSINRGFDLCESLTNVQLNIGQPTDFQQMFYRCTSLVCINALDTTAASDKNGMFVETDSLVNPTQEEQDLLTSEDGYNYTNENPCP